LLIFGCSTRPISTDESIADDSESTSTTSKDESEGDGDGDGDPADVPVLNLSLSQVKQLDFCHAARDP
jgi:hypothetical protein